MFISFFPFRIELKIMNLTNNLSFQLLETTGIFYTCVSNPTTSQSSKNRSTLTEQNFSENRSLTPKLIRKKPQTGFETVY